MRKTIYFLGILIASLSFNSCGDDDGGLSGSGSVSLGETTTSLRSGIAYYEGEYEGSYETVLTILSLSQSDVESLLLLDEDDNLTEEEYEAAIERIIGDEPVSGFYIEAFSDVMERLAQGTYTLSNSYEAFTYGYADVFYDDEYHKLYGEFKVIESAKDYYEIEFLGETDNGVEVTFSFEGDFFYQDYSDDDFSAKSLEKVNSKKRLLELLKK